MLTARPEERTYDSDVVGKGGVGMERSMGISVFRRLGGARLEGACAFLAPRQGGDAERARVLKQALAPAREFGPASFERRAVTLLQ
jgi:hypothetical protein